MPSPTRRINLGGGGGGSGSSTEQNSTDAQERQRRKDEEPSFQLGESITTSGGSGGGGGGGGGTVQTEPRITPTPEPPQDTGGQQQSGENGQQSTIPTGPSGEPRITPTLPETEPTQTQQQQPRDRGTPRAVPDAGVSPTPEPEGGVVGAGPDQQQGPQNPFLSDQQADQRNERSPSTTLDQDITRTPTQDRPRTDPIKGMLTPTTRINQGQPPEPVDTGLEAVARVTEDSPEFQQNFQAPQGPPQDFGGTTQQTSTPRRDRREVFTPDKTLGQIAGGTLAQSIETAQKSPAGDVVDTIADVSQGAAEFANKNIVTPAAELAGDVGALAAPSMQLFAGTSPTVQRVAPEAAEQTRQAGFEAANATDVSQDVRDILRGEGEELNAGGVVEQRFENIAEGVGRGAVGVTVGLPNEVARKGNLALEATEFTGEAIEQQGVPGGAATATAAAGAFATETVQDIAETAQRRPYQLAGSLVGGTIAGTAITPFRLTKVNVPTRRTETIKPDISTARATEGVAGETPNVEVTRTVEDGTTTVRGVRVQAPPVAEALGFRARGRTLLGAKNARPTLGAPSLAPESDRIDLTQLGTTGTATAEARSAFEADVFRQTASDVSPEAGERFRAAEIIQRQAAVTQGQDFTAESAEEAVSQARAVPEGAASDVVEALQETDATVFGSAAANAQLADFRQPRDLDIVVPDKSEAKPVLAEALEGENAQVSEVFDIKEVADVPGRARGGEEIKFGRTSMEPRELGGVPFNPVEEELIRKAGASAFIREPGAAGTPEFDVGPEPRAAGRPDVRQKDIEDTQAIARETGVFDQALGRFEEAYGLERKTPDTDADTGVDLPDQPLFQRFAQGERAQVGFGTRRIDTDRPRRTRTETETTTRTDTDAEGDSRRPDSPFSRPRDGGSPLFGSPDVDTRLPGGFSPSGPGRTDTDGESPGPTGGVPDSPFGPIGDVGRPRSPTGPPTSPDTPPQTPDTPPGSPTIPPRNPDVPPGSPTLPPKNPDIPPRSPDIPPKSPNIPPGEPKIPRNPFIPRTPKIPNQPTRRLREDGDDNDDRADNPFMPADPAGQRFVNPVASGSQFLFGSAIGDSVGGDAVADQLVPGAEGTVTEQIQSGKRDVQDPFDFGLGEF